MSTWKSTAAKLRGARGRLMDVPVPTIRRRYDRFSFFYNFLEYPLEKGYYRHWRKDLLSKVKGNVLELGVGTGKNLPYYNYDTITLTAVDISPRMLEKARKKAANKKYPVKFIILDSERWPFLDKSFDSIVATFVLCSVSDPKKVLTEMRRVLKKNGKIFLLEHVLSKNKLIALWQNIHNPITRTLFGYNINRDTIQFMKDTRWKITEEKNLALRDVYKMIEGQKNG